MSPVALGEVVFIGVGRANSLNVLLGGGVEVEKCGADSRCRLLSSLGYVGKAVVELAVGKVRRVSDVRITGIPPADLTWLAMF